MLASEVIRLDLFIFLLFISSLLLGLVESYWQEYSISHVRQNLVLHLVEVFDDVSLTKMVLNFIFSGYSRIYQWVDQILEYLPEEEEVIALGNQKVHRKQVCRRSRRVVKLL